MLHLLKRRAKGATPAPTMTAPTTAPQPQPDGPQMPTPMLAADMLHRLIRCLARTGQFQGAFDPHPDFHSALMPDTIEITRHQAFLAGGLVDQGFLTLSYAGITGLHLAKLAVDVVMEELFDISPTWQIDDTGTATTRLPFGPRGHWMTIDCITQSVDPWFSGDTTDGATLRIALTQEG